MSPPAPATPPHPPAPRRAWPLRLLCILPGLALAALALADHPSIGGGAGFGATQAAALGLGLASVLAGCLAPRLAALWLLVMVPAALMLGAAELALRALAGPRLYTAYAPDDRALFTLRPGAVRDYTHHPENGGHTVRYRINRDGFRGPELLPAGSRPRIVVYGDSFVHAEFSPLEETFPVRLGERLSAALGREVEVVNAGVAGYGPDQALRRLERELASLAPDLVVLGLFAGNDFGDLLRNRLYGLDADGRLVERAWRYSAEQARQIALNAQELALVRALREALDRLRGGGGPAPFDRRAWIEDALAQHLAEYRAAVEEGEPTVGAFGVDPYSADIALLPASPSAAYRRRLMAAVLGAIAALAREKGVALLAVIIPHPMDLLDGDHDSGLVDREKYPDYRPTALRDAAAAALAEAGIEAVDLFAAFREADPRALYLRGGDDHWNAAGQDLAAALVAEAILARGFPAPR
jgi:lysophospholipase L1-like esterase